MDATLNVPGTIRSRMQYATGLSIKDRIHKNSLALLPLIISHVLYCVFDPKKYVPVVSLAYDEFTLWNWDLQEKNRIYGTGLKT